MAGILFSIPVHERPDIVRDQVENIHYFCPDAYIVIHVSDLAAPQIDEFRRYCDLPKTFVNPKSYETVAGKGILHTHVSNFHHALNMGLDFEKIVLLSSNEMFVKHGVSEHVNRYRLGAQTEVYDLSTDWHLFRTSMLEDERVRRVLDRLGFPVFFGGQAEGQFYDKTIFSLIATLYVENFDMASVGFVVEEMLPPTVAARYCMTGSTAALPITLCDYCTNIAISPENIAQIIAGVGTLYGRRIPRTLRSPHVGASVLQDVYSVKRVPREECDLRTFIRGLRNNPDGVAQTA
ncbi:hypothetical protein [Neorhizobium alkalisoli]|uniref:Uncharacterized protein n=1 Tax=Neorhizobium alkalisoli TaxID=528178 RepID=A0A561QGF8_9HYPH|nr:hypothetical protein [Neorhizobium alkalisoli]TWF49462.1 hypothetical protein FHW37_108132 [Neorhizobium alkalisoli]